MIGQELSFYPDTYAEEQRMAERLSRQPGAFEHSIGNAALNDIPVLVFGSLMGGLVEASPANTSVREREYQTATPHEELKRELASSALSSMLVRQQSIHEALAYQN